MHEVITLARQPSQPPHHTRYHYSRQCVSVMPLRIRGALAFLEFPQQPPSVSWPLPMMECRSGWLASRLVSRFGVWGLGLWVLGLALVRSLASRQWGRQHKPRGFMPRTNQILPARASAKVDGSGTVGPEAIVSRRSPITSLSTCAHVARFRADHITA